MKLRIATLLATALFTFSGIASANWWDGWNNGNGQGSGNMLGKGSTAEKVTANVQDQNTNEDMGSNIAWRNNFGGGNEPQMQMPLMPTSQARMQAPQAAVPQTRMMAPSYAMQPLSFQQMQALMEAQRKQYEAYTKQIAKQQQAMDAAYRKSQQAAPTETETVPTTTVEGNKS